MADFVRLLLSKLIFFCLYLALTESLYMATLGWFCDTGSPIEKFNVGPACNGVNPVGGGGGIGVSSHF